MTFLHVLARPKIVGPALATVLIVAWTWALPPARAADQLLTPAQPLTLAQPLTPAQVEAVEKIIGEYIRDHPEVVRDAVQALIDKRRAEEEERKRMNTRLLSKELTQDPDSPVGGNAQGDVTVVEFFDYRCTYCKAVSPYLRQLLDDDTNLRFVFKEYPILGEISVFAARAALAAERQGKYTEFHFALMTTRGDLNERLVMHIAEQLGLDTDRLRSDMAAPEIDAVIQRNYDLAKRLEVRGTPAFVIGDTLIPGAIEISELKALIEKEREG